MNTKEKLMEAEEIAKKLFERIEHLGLITPGKTEKELNDDIFALAEREFGILKYWHKRIVRSGENTLLPYAENPPNLTLQNDDILFLDFGPILDAWEADFGRTYVIGQDTEKLKLKKAVETAWWETKHWFDMQAEISGAQLWHFVVNLAKKYGYSFGGEIAGHLIGHFPHEKLAPNQFGLYVHPDNHNNMRQADTNGNPREWILEIHFVHTELKIGGFFEQIVT